MSATRPATRILMTTDAVGGVWTYALELARATARHGCEFVLAVTGPEPSSDQAEEASSLPNVKLETAPGRLEWMPKPWEDVDRAGAWLLELAAEHGMDIVHLNGYAHAPLPFGVPRIVVGHSCVCSWWNAVRGGEPDESWATYRSRVAAGLAAADAVVAPSRWMLDELGRWYGTCARGRVIYNGRTMAVPTGPKEPFVLAAGRLWDEAKNTRLLADAAGSVPWPCMVAGEERGPAGVADPSGLRRLSRLPAREMASWMSRASIFAHPARYEPFGLAPLEAALAGCALVLSDIPSLREVWGDAAVYVESDDAASLAGALRRLIERPLERERCAIACRKRAARHTPERFGDAYAQLYQELLAPGSDRATVGRVRAGAAT